MDYIYINSQNLGGEIVLSEDPIFPGIPVNERYSEEFCSRLVAREEPAQFMGKLYNWSTDTFSEPPEPEPNPEPEPIPEPDPVPPSPSAWDALEAQVMFTALMTDTLISDDTDEEGV